MPDGAEELAVQQTNAGVAFWIHVTPRARVAKVGGRHGDALRVAVSQPPIEGRANEACRQALSDALGLRPRHVAIEPSSRGRRKRVEAAGDGVALAARLRELAAGPGVG